MSLGLEMAMLLGIAGVGILALPWSSVELAQSRGAVGALLERFVGKRAAAQPTPASLVPGSSELSPVAVPSPMRASA